MERAAGITPEARAVLEQSLDALTLEPWIISDMRRWSQAATDRRAAARYAVRAAMEGPAGASDVRAVLEQALDALMLQPRAGVSSWSRTAAYRRVAAKRAIRRLLV